LIRLQILDAIETRLTQITTINGYFTDIGNLTDYWSDLPWEYGEVGAVSFNDAEEESIDVGSEQEHRLTIEIEALSFTNDPKTVGVQLLADIKRAIGIDPTWGELALKTAIVANNKNVQTQGRTVVRIAATLEIVYRTSRYAV
jgi:hypothetical protein